MLIIWFLAQKKIVWLHLIILLPSTLFISSFIQLFNGKPENNENDIKVISYNVQMFQLRYKEADSSYLKIAAFLNTENPDIICLQEFYSAPDKLTTDKFRALLKDIGYNYVHFSLDKPKYQYGVATFSRYPIIDKGEVFSSPTGNASVYTDIDINGKVMRVYNNHLQ